MSSEIVDSLRRMADVIEGSDLDIKAYTLIMADDCRPRYIAWCLDREPINDAVRLMCEWAIRQCQDELLASSHCFCEPCKITHN